jgi:hypothetical protein
MIEKINIILSKYANGKYADAAISYSPSLNEYLLTFANPDPHISEKAQAMLARLIYRRTGIQAIVQILRGSTDIELSKLILKRGKQNKNIDLEDVLVYISGNVVDVVLFALDSDINDSKRKAIEKWIQKLFILLDYELGTVSFSFLATKSPGIGQILKYLYVHSPATSQDLRKHMEEKGFRFSSDRWLGSKLDQLARTHAVLWQNGRYLLTEKGLAIVIGTKGRNSSDIQRALALSKKKW